MENVFIVNDANKVGAFIKDQRKSMNVTQDDLANYSGLSRGGIVKIEKEDGDIKLSTFIKVMGLLGFEMVLRKRTNK